MDLPSKPFRVPICDGQQDQLHCLCSPVPNGRAGFLAPEGEPGAKLSTGPWAAAQGIRPGAGLFLGLTRQPAATLSIRSQES